jgi:hypothetical protein
LERDLAETYSQPYDLRGEEKLEEYGPSILHLDSGGRVLARYVPDGIALPEAGSVFPTLPAILAKRPGNRGLESLAITPDGSTLYAAMQSPLALPDEKQGGDSRAVRLLAISSQTGQPTAEYVYPFDDVTRFDAGDKGDQSDMKISGIALCGPDQLLVDERTDEVAKLYVTRIDPAANILGTALDDPAHTAPLEQTDLTTIKPLGKKPVGGPHEYGHRPAAEDRGHGRARPEDHRRADDNDFGMVEGTEAFDAQGRRCSSGIPSRVIVLRLS